MQKPNDEVNRVTYASRRVPRARQAECLAAMRGKNIFAVRAGIRVGKTKIIVDDWGEVASDYPDLLVVAPGGAYRPWPAAVLDDLDPAVAAGLKMYLWDSNRARIKVAIREREDFMAHRGPRVLVVNVEALSTVTAARDLCAEFLRQHPGANQMTIDESVRIKEVDSLCGRACVDDLAPLAARRRIMTGLITPRSPEDLYNQFRFLDWNILGHRTPATFRARYVRTKQVCMLPSPKLYGMLRSRLGLSGYLTSAELRLRVKVIAPDADVSGMGDAAMRQYLEMAVDGGVSRDAAVTAIKALGGYVQTIPVLEGYANLEELNAKIAPHSYTVRLEDCYDMPPSTYSFWDVPWHPEQRRVYEELRANATAELDSMDHVTATQVVVRMMRLHQILCGHAVDEEGHTHEVPEYRTRALVDLLRDYDGKAVIWCSYDHSVRRVAAALEREFGEGSVSRFWGGNQRTREGEEVAFKTEPRRRFEVATPDAGKYGRDWSVANLCIYYSCRNDLDHRVQSEGRIKAHGKTTSDAYVDMRVPGTVEDRVIWCLRQKIDMATSISGDDYREWLI